MAPNRLAIALLAGLALAGCGSSSSSSSSSTSSNSASSSSTQTQTGTATPNQTHTVLGFEGIPIERGPDLASPGTTQTGTVDGISCGPTEQLFYHIHAHLAVYVNGSLRALPAGIGIPGSVAEPTPRGPIGVGGNCIYWLHTHTADGVIHIESPVQRIYSLGNFFDIWHQPLSASTVAGASGKVTAFVDGKTWIKSPAAIPLLPHADIQLDVGTPAPPFQRISWNGTQL